VSFLLFALAAFFNSVMDRLETEISFNDSVFSKLNKDWWCKPISAHKVKFLPLTKYRPDGWHISKSLMIFCLAGSIAAYTPLFGWVDFIMLGVVWNLVFELFYANILRK
jgi:hypothetical protein